MVSNIDATMELLCSAHKLDRDRGLFNLEQLLASTSVANEESLRKCLERDIMTAVLDSNCSWEKKHGCLLALKMLIECQGCRVSNDTDFSWQVHELALKLLNDNEARVRLAAGALLGVLCRAIGPKVYVKSRDLVMNAIKSNLDRIPGDDPSRREIYDTTQLMDKLMSGPSLKKRYSLDSSNAVCDMSGWPNLETSLKSLEFMIEGCGEGFHNCTNEDFFLIIFITLSHSNRYVRETGFYVLSTLLKNWSDSDGFPTTIKQFEGEICKQLVSGLADSWSQVRLSASIATRHFLLPQPDQMRHQLYPTLLPPMCLNRYYAADGVRIYSQETWRQITGSDGKLLVEQYIDPTVEYYSNATKSNNSAVREAACSCIAELVVKVSADKVRPWVQILLTTLLDCFHDPSWPVRDAASLACGSLVLNYSEECRSVKCTLYNMFYEKLGDAIPSVRQGAASALSNMVRAYGDPALNKILDFIQTGLQGIKFQKVEDTDSTDGPSWGVCGKRVREMECSVDAYPPSQIESERPTQPWQLADGCIYLVGELSNNKEAHSGVISSLPLLKEACRQKHYKQHCVFLESVCKQLPVIARNIGKRIFSTMVEDFFDDIFYALESGSGSCSSAASQCVTQLAALLGHNVLRAKINNHSPRHVAAFESVIFTAPF